MNGPKDNLKRLARLLDEAAVHEGVHPTRVEGVQLVRRSQPRPRTPMIYAPKITIVGQGQKRAYLGEEVYVYDPSNYPPSRGESRWAQRRVRTGTGQELEPPG